MALSLRAIGGCCKKWDFGLWKYYFEQKKLKKCFFFKINEKKIRKKQIFFSKPLHLIIYRLFLCIIRPIL